MPNLDYTYQIANTKTTQGLENKLYTVKTDSDSFIINKKFLKDKTNVDIFYGGSTTELLFIDEAIAPSLKKIIKIFRSGNSCKMLGLVEIILCTTICH